MLPLILLGGAIVALGILFDEKPTKPLDTPAPSVPPSAPKVDDPAMPDEPPTEPQPPSE